MKETQFIDDRHLRDKNVSRFDVLEKVKDLLLISGTDYAVLSQVADYYEVGLEAIASLVKDNREELLEDGLINATGVETKEILGKFSKDFANQRGYFTCDGIKFNHRNNLLFTRRSILRVGMLLRDSVVAKEVRTQLLNIEEKTSDDVKIQDITEEQSLMLAVGMAFASGDLNAFATASTNLVAFKNRHIEQLQADNEKLENDNMALAGDILEWSDRKKMSAGIRRLKTFTTLTYADLWNELYRNLQYKYGISLKQRGKSPFIQHVKESEWDKVIKVFSAMCEAYGQSPTDMFKQTAISR
ncbi:MAG: hypothetical protein SO206_06700 [Bacilli bacterium]|nr:hypothetical protein [Bacilli bacterium]